MKRTLLILSALFISMTVFGQKNELKAAQKAIDASNYAAANTALSQAEGLMAGADQKLTAQYYYLKAMALYKNGAGTDYEKINDAFNELIQYEKGTKVKYTPEINELKKSLITAIQVKAGENYNTAVQTQSDADYAKAAKGYYMVYALSPSDTMFLDNATILYSKANDFEKSNEYAQQLLDLGYTGIAEEYIATGVDGKDVLFASKKDMDGQVRLKLVTNPRTEIKESRRKLFYDILAKNYMALEEYEKGLEAVSEGRKEFPDSYELLIVEANINFKMDNKAKFKELLEEAITKNPTDPNLYYNVGVMNLDQNNIDEAISNFEKAIELKPDFVNAYQNIGTAIIDKTKPIVEEMNKSLSDFNKYDKLKAQQLEVYKEALPYYEKAFELDSENIGVVQTLLGLYENLQDEEKTAEFRALYNGMKE